MQMGMFHDLENVSKLQRRNENLGRAWRAPNPGSSATFAKLCVFPKDVVALRFLCETTPFHVALGDSPLLGALNNVR